MPHKIQITPIDSNKTTETPKQKFRVNSDNFFVTDVAITGLPASKIFSNGGVAAMWLGYDEQNSSFYGQRFESMGNFQGKEFSFNPDSQMGSLRMFTLPINEKLPYGGFAATWLGGNSPFPKTYSIYISCYDSLANRISSINQVNEKTYTEYFITPASLPDGSSIITWLATDGNNSYPCGRHIDVNCNPQGTEFKFESLPLLIYEGSLNLVALPISNKLLSGGYAVTWANGDLDKAYAYAIQGKCFDALSNKQIGSFYLNLTYLEYSVVGMVALPVSSKLPEGGFISILQSFNFTSLTYGQRFDSHCVSQGQKFFISECDNCFDSSFRAITLPPNNNLPLGGFSLV